MSGLGRFARILMAGIVTLSLSACVATFRNHGYMPVPEDVDFLVVGVDTRETVAAAIGPPGTAGLLTDSGWYYVQSRFRHFAYQEPEEIEREILAISFDTDGVVENIERFGLEDGRVIALSRRVTDSNVKGISFIRQLFGNFGRIDVSQLL